MKKTTVKKVFIFFLIYLPLQYAAVGVVGLYASEPWPAFILPAFQNADGFSRYITVKEPVMILEHGRTYSLKITPQQLFNGIQHSQLQGFMRSHFGSSDQWSNKGEQARQWLKDQIKLNYPSSTPDRLRVQWEKKYYNFSSSTPRLDSTVVLNNFTIRL